MKDRRTFEGPPWVDQASVFAFEASVSVVQTWYLAMTAHPCLRKHDTRCSATSNKSLCSSLFSTNSQFLTKRGSFVLQNTPNTPHMALRYAFLHRTDHSLQHWKALLGPYYSVSEFTCFLKCIYSLQAKNCRP